MDTVLNLGMNDQVVEGLAIKTNNPRFAWDSYRRFLEMFGNGMLMLIVMARWLDWPTGRLAHFVMYWNCLFF